MKNGRNRQEGKSWFILLVTAVMLSMSILVGAETVTWNNVSGGLWNAYTNWTPIGVPVPGDNVVVNNAGANTVLLNSAATINTLTIADDSNLTLGSGQLTLTSAIPTVLYNLTITKAGDGSGTVKSLPAVIDCGTSCNSVFEKGSIVTLTANPSVGSLFNGWTGGDCTGTDVCYATMNADTNVMATFTKIPAPSAAFMAAPAVNLNVQFTDTSTGNPTSWLWDFGDGGTSTSQNPSHTYANSGTYSVSLTASNITGSNTFITYIGVTAPGSSRLTFAPVPDSDQITKTNVLINQAYVNLYPELMNETLVRAMFSDINAVIAKDPGNKKRYELNKLIVYPDSDFNTTTDNVTNNPIYFSDNNFVSNPSFGGATLLLWYYTGSGQDFINNKPKFFVENGNGTGYNTVNMINGKKYSMSYIARTGAEDYLLILRDSPLTYVNGFGAHDAALGGVLHELVGHGGAGLGYPEEYSLNFVDNSGTLPNLGVFDFTSLFPTDSMGKFDVVKYNILENRFNDLNYYFIGNNPVSQFDLYQISNVVKTMTIKVKVVDAFGNPVPAAVVTSYGGVAVVPGTGIGSPQNMIALLETLTTDANGMATLTNDFNVSWFAKGIKAVKGPQLGGAVLTSVDLKKAYWMQNINEHFMDITIQ